MFKTTIFYLALFVFSFSTFGQKKILHYSETSGFDHNTRINSELMFAQFGIANTFVITNDRDGSAFDSLNNLLQFDVIVFSNTSGNSILNNLQQSNFEQYITNGGALLGIHAATDTYRHSSANGNLTGSWDFYPETMGGSVQENPNHVAGTPNYTIEKIAPHPSVKDLPNLWSKNEEYYYWENGFLDTAIHVVLKVEQTVGPNNRINSYDSSRAVAWEKTLVSGSRVFYTSLGHANSNYTSDTLFQGLILNAIKWCLGLSVSSKEIHLPEQSFKIHPNPATTFIQLENTLADEIIYIYSEKGEFVSMHYLNTGATTIDINHLTSGIYFVKIGASTEKLIVQ